jgi:N-acetylglucosaminyldiphosphoundecaprenol N-acetyl-beta-D-mannosaminyltransferase
MIEIIGVRIHSTNYAAAASQVLAWARAGESRYVCAANVHMLMEAYDSPDFCHVVNAADLVTPDGMPLVWVMRSRGAVGQGRVYGPTLMLHVVEKAASQNVPIGLLGGTPEVLELLNQRLKQDFPSLKIVFSVSPPFRALTDAQEAELVELIQASGVRILFVGLGCPKQERWMAEHREKVSAVMLGVGAAFDFHAGQKRQAPAGLQKLGLEWLFRLLQEPGRLWRRYLINNPRFILLVILESLGWLKRLPAD